nr:MAG TPA: hypothetical protein [Caudoviricetes sp.]
MPRLFGGFASFGFSQSFLPAAYEAALHIVADAADGAAEKEDEESPSANHAGPAVEGHKPSRNDGANEHEKEKDQPETA